MQLSKSFVLITALLLTVSATTWAKKKKQPNIIYILADDLGYGDLSCYGQKKFYTPNIDQLAIKGIQFTDHYAGCTVCAPSRAVLMTGKHTGHTEIRGNKEHRPEGQHPISDQTLTIAELLKQAGYATGAFGKWGLGYPSSEGDPIKQGFDQFYGYNCQAKAHNYYPYHLWHNNKKIILEGNKGREQKQYAPNLIHKQAIKFIEDNSKRPFFMYYPSVIPHAELFAPEEYMVKYRGKFLPEKSYRGHDSGRAYKNGGYGSQPEGHAAFAAMINLLDDQIGQIVAKLEELGIADNTIIIFSSDNGPHLEGGADPKYFNSNGNLRGFKRDLYEGGIRMPMIVKWPNKIKAGRKTNHISAFWDIMPTLAEVAGIEIPNNIDGISFYPTLIGKKHQTQHQYMYWEFHNRRYQRQAIRMGKWKGIRQNAQNKNEPIELYNLSNDLGETKNIAHQHPEIVEQIREQMTQAHQQSEFFKFDYEKEK